MVTLTLIVKPVGDKCPLHCDYCYNSDPLLPHRQQSPIMTDEVVESLVYNLLQYKQRDRPVIIWHGGEPTLAGISFYERALNTQQKIADRLGTIIPANHIQTSGVTITEEWAKFFKRNSFKVGVSLDGPAKIHDAYRKYPSGRGSHADVIRGLNSLEKFKVSVAIGAVVTRKSTENPIETFEFLRSQSSVFEFSPYFGTAAVTSKNSPMITPDEYANFMISVFDYWWEIDDPRIRIKIFRHYVEAALGQTPRRCSMASGCHNYLSVDGNGTVYPCGRLAGLPELRLGSTLNQTFEEIQSGTSYTQYMQEAQYAPEECKKCKWYYACNNGCTAARYTETHSFLPKSPLCEATKRILEHVAAKVNRENGNRLAPNNGVQPDEGGQRIDIE